ncbi:MAG: hypothetical protein DSM107014_06155 [Gomphosphaeria aponina SAG 52.96 = DSM 107014]|uniref:Glycine zipper 2TM domain-containing protein n=1 Tax=Gomphosphaeria aponina SAG 52.96 = DSM 107014 TaxID=1521640 RepID=A0A941GPG8_9CHRO|nr:hypothetical protein [Gomphosphaeria aponina SAG 52.96 = DSM 107014]
MKKILATGLTALAASTAVLTTLPQSAKALTFGEAVGVAAGAVVINQVISNDKSQNQYRSPEQEYNRGLEDGYNRARYDNPRNSHEYDEGYTEGGHRLGQGWSSPFSD